VAKYVLVRVGQAVPTMIGVAIVGFFLVHLVPGDPGRIALGPRASEIAVRAFDDNLGVNGPIGQQFVRFLSGVTHLQFGQSFTQHESVSAAIASRIAPTALLIGYGFLIAVAVTVPVSLFVAVRRDRAADHAVRAIGMVCYAMPVFWLGLLLSLVFGLQLGVLPTSGYASGLSGALKSLTLPAVTLALITAPLFIRTLRASVIGALDAGYVEAARSRGLSERRVLYRHALRNASIPFVTLVGLTVGALVSGAVVIENVFALPGLGSLLVSAVTSRDFALVQGLVVLLGLCVVVINLLADVLCAVLDPRIRP